jgi:4-amino-4-deoxy-L-arabinose transferase-like glycosyltransferase
VTAGERRAALVILAGAAVLFLLRPSARTFTNRDVSRYAQMAFEMRHEHTLVPLLHRRPYHEATPLTAWAPLAVASLEGEVEPLSGRILPALAALVMVGGTLVLAARYLSGRAALLAAAAVALNYLLATYGRQSRIDPVWGLGTAGAVGFFFHAVERGRWRWFLACGVALAVAIAAKGPVAGAVIGAALGPYVLVRGSWKRAVTGGALAVALGILLTALWFLPYKNYLGPDEYRAFYEQFMMRENFEKFETGYEKPHWPGFYVVRLSWHLAPWIVGFWVGIARVARRPREAAPLALLAASWVLGPLLVFEVASGKQMRYMLPLVPGFAILAALEAERWLDSKDSTARRALDLGLRGAAVSAVAFGVLAPVAVAFHGRLLEAASRFVSLETPVAPLDLAPAIDAYSVAVGLGTAIAGGAALLLLGRRRLDRALVALFLAGSLAVTFFYVAVLPLAYAERASSPYYVLAGEIAPILSGTCGLTVDDERLATDRATIDDGALGLQLGRWVDRSRDGLASREDAVLSRIPLPGRTVLRSIAWRSHASEKEPESWYLLSPAR